MEIAIYIIVGFVVLFATIMLINRRAAHGTLKIDRRNPNKDEYLFVINDKDLERLHTKKKLILYIDPNADLSQK